LYNVHAELYVYRVYAKRDLTNAIVSFHCVNLVGEGEEVYIKMYRTLPRDVIESDWTNQNERIFINFFFIRIYSRNPKNSRPTNASYCSTLRNVRLSLNCYNFLWYVIIISRETGANTKHLLFVDRPAEGTIRFRKFRQIRNDRMSDVSFEAR